MTPPPLPPKNILVCLSTGPRAVALAGEAAALARAYGAGSLHAVHAGADSPATRRQLEAIVRETGWEGELHLLLEDRKPAEAALHAARKANADLVVAGALEKEKLTRELFGSTARQLARKMPLPVMLLTNPRPEGTAYKRLGISTQLDKPTRLAMEFTIDLARRMGTGELHLLRESSYFDRAEKRWSPVQHGGTMTSTSLLELQTFAESFDFGTLKLTLAELGEGEGFAAADYGRTQHLDLLVYPSPPRTLTFWDRFFNHSIELVLEHLPHALLIHRPKQRGA
ncbi:MAG: hypothetical protein PWP23_2760 [Candidatus Sumerlaeota bacterium]|nr:hypothetical protein [Candidatus Sumerlaeota bacterium]